MSKILVVDDIAFCRELVADVLRSHGHECVSAPDGSVAWEMMLRATVDLVICDMAMPIVDGTRFVRALRSDDRFRHVPVIMLTAVQQRESIVEVMKLGVRDYLLKSSFSLAELLSRVERLLSPVKPSPVDPAPPASAGVAAAGAVPVSVGAPSVATPPAALPADASTTTTSAATAAKVNAMHLPRLIERDVAAQAAADFDGARTLGGISAELLRLTASADVNLNDVSRVLRQDPILAGRAFRIANADACLAGRSRAVTIEEAVRRIAPADLKSLAASAGVLTTFRTAAADGLDMLRCWQHSFAVANIMERLVPNTETLVSGMAYAVGLCHDLGEILLRQRFPDEFRAAEQFAAQSKQPFALIQSHVLGLSATDLSGAVMAAINAPPLLAEAIVRFRDPAPARASNGATELLTVSAAETLATALRLANEYAHALQLGSIAGARVSPMGQAPYRTAMLVPTTIGGAEIRSEAIMTVNDLAQIDAADQKTLNEPLVETRVAHIGYARHASFAAVDPLEAALGQLVKVRTSSTIPGPADLASYGGLIVAVPQLNTSGFGLSDIDRARRAAGKPSLPVLVLTADPTDVIAPANAGMRVARLPIDLLELAAFTAAC